MNQKEVHEIRRRLTPDKTSIGRIYGCYVNQNRTVIARTEASVGMLSENDAEKYLAILRGVLSGRLGKNLLDLSFSIAQVENSEEHKLLMDLRRTMLDDASLREAICDKIISSYDPGDANYLILLAADAYDVPKKNRADDDNGSDSVFRYILAAICPVTDGKVALGYSHEAGAFHATMPNQVVGAPLVGFLFPAFDDRQANIYNILYYTRKTDDLKSPLIETLFGTPVPLSAKKQNEAFRISLAEALDKECRFETVQSVHEVLREKLEAHRDSRDPSPLEITARDVSDILLDNGVSPEKAEAFREKVGKELGSEFLLPANIIDAGKFELETVDVKIKVDPKSSGTIRTCTVDGKKYILIPADSGVVINGLNVHIPEDD